MSMITSSTWVLRGYAAPFPTKQEFNDEEFERIAALAKLQLSDAAEELQKAKAKESNGAREGSQPSATEDEPVKLDTSVPASRSHRYYCTNSPCVRIQVEDDDLREYDLDHYDDDDDDNDDDDEDFLVKGGPMSMFSSIKSLAYHESGEDDPYVTLQDTKIEEDEEREELQILATDNLVLATKVEDGLSHLEVYVYEDDADNIYIHHDITLPDIPLCVEWLNIPVNKPGVEKDSPANFVAIGTMDPDIEIWDLDTVDSMFPNAILGQGGSLGEQPKKKKKKKTKKANEEYHTDAVLSLAANWQHRNLLASASSDKTVKLWDLHTAKCAKSYSYHTDKVCSIGWHSVESTVLLSGSYDRTVVAADLRAPDAKPSRWGVESDVENVKWDSHDQNFFYVSTENGMVHYHDVRNIPSDPTKTKAVWTLQAHEEAVSALDINVKIPGYIATGSSDKTVKLWNVQPDGPGMVVSRNLDVGRVFTVAFAPDSEVAFRLAVGGSKGSIQVWDTSTNSAVRKAFATRMPTTANEVVEERLVGLAEDESDSNSDEGEEGSGPDSDAMNEN